jgi:hypothetical protein
VYEESVLPPYRLAPLTATDAFFSFSGIAPSNVDSIVYNLENVGILKRFDSVMSTVVLIPAISMFRITRHAIALAKYLAITTIASRVLM